MIEWLYQNFPVGKNYLVAQHEKEEINSFLMERLVTPFQTGRKHNLWGKTAEKLSQLGQILGWIPNQLPAIFLTETVENTIADAMAAAERYLQPVPKHFELARALLKRFDLINLALQNPMFLSEGETKIVWFLTQWVKRPIYLIIGHLPSGLSKGRIADIINFLVEENRTSDISPIIILGYHLDQTDWCANLLSNKQWQTITGWPGNTSVTG
jgi:ABC-type molybdenum transport system ATPase subunit/photorepair protein PhrA